jgi:hypothetical protein
MSTGVTVIVVIILVCVVTAAALPAARHAGRGVEEMGHHQMDRQFQRPANESELL